MKPPLQIHPTRASSIRDARQMRKNPTDAERRLWSYLRGRQGNGFKFRRQHPIGPFIVDFCCIEKKLVIELDGEQHLDAQQYDASRTEQLQKEGYRVIRFWNVAVLTNIAAVLEQISVELMQ
jgi:very-short-patch-repair endonuclease